MFSVETLAKYKACKKWCKADRFIRELEECTQARRRGTIRRKKDEKEKFIGKWRIEDLNKMERLWVDVMTHPDNFPPNAIPKSHLKSQFRVAIVLKRREGAE